MGELGGPGEDDLCERGDGDVGTLSGADLVGYPAVEFASKLPSGEEINSEELQ